MKTCFVGLKAVNHMEIGTVLLVFFQKTAQRWFVIPNLADELITYLDEYDQVE